MKKVLVDLDWFPDLGLIIKADTGACYTQQSGGLGCVHPQAEGYFVPLSTKVGRPELASIQGAFRGDWHNLDESQADALDKLLHRHGFTAIKVNRELLHESWEAWVHVTIIQADGDRVPLSNIPAEPIDAILVWPNSD